MNRALTTKGLEHRRFEDRRELLADSLDDGTYHPTLVEFIHHSAIGLFAWAVLVMDISFDLSEIVGDESIEFVCDVDNIIGAKIYEDAICDTPANSNRLKVHTSMKEAPLEDEVQRPITPPIATLGSPQNPPAASSAIASATAIFIQPLEAMADTLEEKLHSSLDSTLSCCQWLHELADSTQSPLNNAKALEPCRTGTSSPDCPCPCDDIKQSANDKGTHNVTDESADDTPPHLLQIQSTESSDTATKATAKTTLHSIVIRNTPSLLSDSSSEDEGIDQDLVANDGQEENVMDGNITDVTNLLTEDGLDGDITSIEEILVRGENDDDEDLMQDDINEDYAHVYSGDGNSSDVVRSRKEPSTDCNLIGSSTIKQNTVIALGGIKFIESQCDVDELSDDCARKEDDAERESRGCNPRWGNADIVMEHVLHEMDEYVVKKKIQYNSEAPGKRIEETSGTVLSDTPPSTPSNVTPLSSTSTGTTEDPDISFQSAAEGAVELHAAETDSDDGTADFFLTPCCHRKKRLSFADDHGLELERTRFLEPPPETSGRIVVLLLSPSERVFEFLHIECPYDETTTVQVLVEQLPALAAMDTFRYTKFIGLARIKSNVDADLREDKETCEELRRSENDNPLPTILNSSLLLGNIGFRNCELVLAVPEKLSCSDVVVHAFPLLLNGTIMKALHAGRRSGRGLKYMKNGINWFEDAGTRESVSNTVEKDSVAPSYREWGVVADLADNVVLFEWDTNDYISSCDDMQVVVDDDDEEIILGWTEEFEAAISLKSGRTSNALRNCVGITVILLVVLLFQFAFNGLSCPFIAPNCKTDSVSLDLMLLPIQKNWTSRFLAAVLTPLRLKRKH